VRRSPSSAFPPALAVALVLGTAVGCGNPTRPDVVPEECLEHLTLPSLAAGQAVQLSGRAAVLVCPAPPDADGEYLLVLHQASGDPADSLRIRVGPRSLEWPGEEPDLLPGAAPVAVGTARAAWSPAHGEAPPHIDLDHHVALRELERRSLGPLVTPGPLAPTAAPPRAPTPVPTVGSLIELNTHSQEPCDEAIHRTGRVAAVSSRAIVVADTLNPAGGFDDHDYARFAAAFDTLVAPLAEGAFGEASNVAGHGRTILFFTQEVNRLSAPGSGTVILGFFFARDLFPTEPNGHLQGCRYSNEAEILYLLVPDPDGTIHGNRRSRSFVDRRVPSTLVHEYQHLINAARRLHVVRTSTPFEETWLNEGLSHIAEELLFFRAAGLEPGNDLAIEDLRAGGDRVMDAINDHHLANVLRFRHYLRAPASNSPYDTGALLPTRGAAWHFLRYALDRRGGAPQEVLRPLVDGPGIGVANLASALGGEATLHEWLADWSVALYADSRVEGLAERHRDRSWNHASIFRALDEQENNSSSSYPLEPLMLRVDGPVDRRIMGGGSDYIRFGIAAGDSASVQLTTGGGFPPASLRATLLRIR
jgi:hypothetical protein